MADSQRQRRNPSSTRNPAVGRPGTGKAKPVAAGAKPEAPRAEVGKTGQLKAMQRKSTGSTTAVRKVQKPPSDRTEDQRKGRKRPTSTRMRPAVSGGTGNTGSHAAAGSSGGKTGRRNQSQSSSPAARPPKKPTIQLGLALKFIIPVGLLIAMVVLVWATLVGRRAQKILVNEIKKDGAAGVQGLSLFGRTLVDHYQQAYENREYEKGVYWPVEVGAVSGAEFDRILAEEARAKGEEPQTGRASRDVFFNALSKASILKPYSFFDAQSATTQVLYAWIQVGDNNYVIAASRPVNDATIVPGTVLGIQDSLTQVDIGDTIDLRKSGIDVYEAMLTETSGEQHKVLVFTKNIPQTTGKAFVALSADVIENEIGGLQGMMLTIGFVAFGLGIAVVAGVARWIVAPVKTLIRDMNIVAGGNLDHRTRMHSGDEIGLIASEFNEMTRRLLIARNAEKEAERLENELDMAREIQMKLLPSRVPAVKGLDMHAVYQPAKEVGGDYYDFFPIDKEHLGIIVADVSGKGIPGSMVMATTRTILRFVASGNTSAADTLAKTNAIVAADIKRGMFVTAYYLVLNARQYTLLCASAGHNPMVLMRGGGELELINPNGIALGFDKGPIFQRTIKEQLVQLGRGDRIVLYTDGVVESMNAQNEEYTDDRFYAFCKTHRDADSKTFVQKLLDDLEQHKGRAEQHDDITVVTLRLM